MASEFGYTGQVYIASLNAYYYKARFYSRETGRFLSPDPIGYSDSMNLHGYVGGDPVNNLDPAGTCIVPIYGHEWQVPSNDPNGKPIPGTEVTKIIGWDFSHCVIPGGSPSGGNSGGSTTGGGSGDGSESRAPGTNCHLPTSNARDKRAAEVAIGVSDLSLLSADHFTAGIKMPKTVDLGAIKFVSKTVTYGGGVLSLYQAVKGDTSEERALARQDFAIATFGEAVPQLALFTSIPYAAGRTLRTVYDAATRPPSVLSRMICD